MAYAAQSDLCPARITERELGQLTADDGSGTIDTDIVSAVLEDASARIDSYCRARYQTPLQASDTVTSLTLDIALYLLFTRRRNTKSNETVRQNYQDAIALLKDISAGKAQLDQPANATAQTMAGGAQVSRKPQRFAEPNIEGFC